MDLFDDKGNKIGSANEGITPNYANVYDKHNNLVGTVVVQAAGQCLPSVEVPVGLTCLIVGLGLIPYIGLGATIYAAYRVLTFGMHSISKGFRIFAIFMSVVWSLWAIWASWYAGYFGQGWDSFASILIVLALLTQLPALLILSFSKTKSHSSNL